MRRLAVVLAGMLAFGCYGGSSSSKDESFTCEQSDRTGTYYVDFETLSGDCGEFPDGLSRSGSDVSFPDGCMLDQPDTWSADNCKLERSHSCGPPTIQDGYTASYVSVSEQQDPDGDVITGTTSVTVRNSSTGRIECEGVYRVTMTRQ